MQAGSSFFAFLSKTGQISPLYAFRKTMHRSLFYGIYVYDLYYTDLLKPVTMADQCNSRAAQIRDGCGLLLRITGLRDAREAAHAPRAGGFILQGPPSCVRQSDVIDTEGSAAGRRWKVGSVSSETGNTKVRLRS